MSKNCVPTSVIPALPDMEFDLTKLGWRCSSGLSWAIGGTKRSAERNLRKSLAMSSEVVGRNEGIN